jgi:hypothetical protein
MTSAIKHSAWLYDQTGGVNFSRDDRSGLNFDSTASVHDTIEPAPDNDRITHDRAFHRGVLAEYQSFRRDERALHGSIEPKRAANL